MESPSWPESIHSYRIKALHELIKGQEPIDKLRKVLQWSQKTDATSIDSVAVQIVTVFENTLSNMCYYDSNWPLKANTSDLHSSCSSDGPKSEDQHPTTVIPLKVKRGCYKRRKNTWSSTTVTSALVDDGHAWRKYGQKQILNSKYERSYYRCTYKLDQGCLATKQVQMIEDKPPNYKVTYFGHHTCKNIQRAPSIILGCPDPKDASILLNFDSKEIIEKKQIEPNLPTVKYEQGEGFPTSCNTYHPFDQYTQAAKIPFESISMISSELGHVDVISPWLYSGLDNGDKIAFGETSSIASSQVYDMDHMFEMNGFDDFSI